MWVSRSLWEGRRRKKMVVVGARMMVSLAKQFDGRQGE